jgi:hypothetical protein
MDEASQRWKARIGAIKWVGLVGVIGFGILFIIVLGSLRTALNNPRQPQPVTIQQLVDGSIGTDQYVSIEGFALYEEGYEEVEGSSVVATYYLMLDDLYGYIVLVQASSNNVDSRNSDYASVSGMTESTGTDLRDLVRSDAGYYADVGYVTTPTIYIAEGKKPSDPGLQGFLAVILAGGIVLSIVPFFFPTTVFIPKTVEMSSVGLQTKAKGFGIRATGRFLQLKKIKPQIVPGKRNQKFTEAQANIVTLDGGNMMIYIHHVVRYNFIPISKTHWGVFLAPRTTSEIQPGLKLGWKDRPAVEIRYPAKDSKIETLIISFDHAVEQVDFVKALRERGFRVGTGIRGSTA